jgi:SpoVK/Ycf46/Vps4 family AAA+-type ATPase
MRPGRLDVQLYCPPPDPPGRLAVLQVHSRGMPLAPDVDLAALAERAEHFTGEPQPHLLRWASGWCAG